MSRNLKETASSIKWWLIVLILVVCFGLWILGIWATNYFTGTPEAAGVLGDSAGAINALFSALAFSGVVIAIFFAKERIRASTRRTKSHQ
jgi:uncharacterized membrane protein